MTGKPQAAASPPAAARTAPAQLGVVPRRVDGDEVRVAGQPPRDGGARRLVPLHRRRPVLGGRPLGVRRPGVVP